MMFPKNPPGRNQHYRDMACGKYCTLVIPGVCCHDPETTVLAHSNRGQDGKGMGMKADDAVGAVWACHTCHQWLDQGKAPAEEKRQAVLRAMGMMEDELLQIAGNILSSAKDRAAAKWALERIIAAYEKQG